MNAGAQVYMRIPVNELPDGYFREQLMKLARTEKTQVGIVAKAGHNNDWACYIGWPQGLSEYGEAKDRTGYYRGTLMNEAGIASNGYKLDKETAEFLFGNLFKGRTYR